MTGVQTCALPIYNLVGPGKPLDTRKFFVSGLELRNDLYFGSGEQRLYNRFGNYLYWGDLMYKLPVYDRTDLVIHFLKSNILDIDLELSLHFAEGSVYNQQILRTTVDIDNIDRRQINRSYRYIWHW